MTTGIAVTGLVMLAVGAALGWFARAAAYPPAPPGPSARPEESLRPVHEALGHLAGEVRQLEDRRTSGLSSLEAQVQQIARSSVRLTERTDQLINSLRSPTVRGRWGEMQLERVVELGGMVRHCDFDSQVTSRVDGRIVRPDLVVRLSHGRQIVVDAKVPYGAYIDAMDTTDPEEQTRQLRRHAAQLREHVDQLASRDYIRAFSPTPEFVVLFVPADPFLDVALEIDPQLLEYAFGKGVVIATPTTLFVLLRTVALTWRQDDYSDKARRIHELGQELYARINTVVNHFNEVGRHLDQAASAYNSTLASVDSRLAVTARKLSDMGVPARSDRQPTEPRAATETTRHVGP